MRPYSVDLPSYGTSLPLVLEVGAESGPLELRVDLPFALGANGAATTGPAEIIAAGGEAVARVDVGQCLLSPAGQLWCELPWEESGEQYYAWLAGTLREERRFSANALYVGLPPRFVRFGSWRPAAREHSSAAAPTGLTP